jgi:hypothetical protein
MAARKRKRDLDAEAEKRFRAATNPPVPPAATSEKTTWTRAEVDAQEQRVEGLLLQAASTAQIVATLRDMGVKRRRAAQLVSRIRDRWSRETEATRAYTRDEQIRRVKRYIQRLQGRPKIVDDQIVGWHEQPNYPMLHRWESLLADLEGNKEPLKINVDVRYTEAMLAVVGSMPGEDLLRLAQEQREIEAKARAYDEGIVVRQLPIRKAG